MSISNIIYRKILNVFLGLLNIFKRAICRVQRMRKNSGSLLPMTTDQINVDTVSTVQQSVPLANDVELESWDSWGTEDQSGGSASHASNHAPTHPDPANYVAGTRFGASHAAAGEPEPEPDIDFFQDMVPAVKKHPKILLKRRDDHRPAGLSSRLTMTSEIPVTDGTLGTWEEGDTGAWGAEATEDLSWEADAAIKDRKRLDREQRMVETQKKKAARDAQRQRKDSTGNSHAGISAVKLS